MYIGQVSSFVTVYLTVAFSIQRYKVVFFPLLRVQNCSKRKANITIFGIVSTALLIFSYVWIIAEVIGFQGPRGNVDMCSVSESYYKTSEIANYFDTAITLIIPFFIIVYFNVKTAIKVCESEKERRLMAAGAFVRKTTITNGKGKKRISILKQEIFLGRMQYDICDCIQIIRLPLAYVDNIRVSTELVPKVGRKSSQQRNEYSDTHVTKTLLLVSIVFLGLNLPLHLIRCAQFMQVNYFYYVFCPVF